MRFVTGSSVNTGRQVTVVFNGTDGAARQIGAHTCSCQIELSVSYSTSLEFASDMKRMLDNDHAWVMAGW